MTETHEHSVIAQFLGPDAAKGGPFAILGLKHEPINQGMILRASRRRLDRINAHPRSRTPLADEVRLAVNTAASQLLDPELRAELAKVWPEGSGQDTPSAWRFRPAAVLDPKMRSRAIRILGAAGGWNRRSRTRLSHFARTNRIPPVTLLRELSGSRSSSARPGASQNTPRQGAVRVLTADEALRGISRGGWGRLIVLYAAMAGILLGTPITINALTATNKPALSETVDRAAPETIQTGRAEPEPAARTHKSAILHELGVLADTSAPPVDGVVERLRTLERRWTEFTPAELDEATARMTRVVTALELEDLHEVLAAAKDDDRSVYGHAVRLMWSDPSSRMDLETALHRAFDTDAGSPPGSPDGWDRWIEQLKAFADRDPVRAAQAMRDSVNAAMRDPIGTNERWAESARRIVQQMNWSAAQGSRVWLIRVIDDPDARAERLAVFLQAVVTHSSASGIDTTQVPTRDATMEERARFVRHLRDVWSSSGSGGVERDTRIAILDRLEVLTTLRVQGLTPGESMARLIELATVNEASRALSSGNSARAQLLMDDLNRPDQNFDLTVNLAQIETPSSDRDDAEALWNAGSTEGYTNAISAVSGRASIGPWGAQGLIAALTRAPDVETRELAAGVIQRHQHDASVLIALDAAMNTDRPNRFVLEVLGEMLGVENERDPDRLKRMLRARMVDAGLLGSVPELDDIESRLAALTIDDTETEDKPSLLNATASFRASIETEIIKAGAMLDPRVSAEHTIGSRRARGAIERSLVERWATTQRLAQLVGIRSPALRPTLEPIVGRARLELERSERLDEQLLIIEQAATRIWMLVIEMELVT